MLLIAVTILLGIAVIALDVKYIYVVNFYLFSIQNNVENLESTFETFIYAASGIQKITDVSALFCYHADNCLITIGIT